MSERAHAVIIGGGIAGLLAARILLDHFESVTLIERDHYPQEPVFRSGTPQARQLHATLLRGQRILEELFPLLREKLLAHGAFERDYGNESLYFYGGDRPGPTVPPVLHGWNCSRMLLEWQIRQELAHVDQLRIIEGHQVTNLLIQQDAVAGVQFRERNHQSENEIHKLNADLVVDTSGPSSHMLQWLQDAGVHPPRETIIPTTIGYATQFYEPPAHSDWKGIVIRGTQARPRGGVLMTVEKGRWMVVLSGKAGDYPPTKNDTFLAFAQSLPHPALYEAMKAATPISPIYGYRTENRLRHFEQLRQLKGLIVMGDALCSFNPVYGQGISVASMEAQLLDSCLRQNKGHITQTFQKKAARLLRTPWMSVIRVETQTEGFVQWYIERLMTLLPDDPATFLTLLEVGHMIRPPSALFHPKILLKVLTHPLGHAQRRAI